MNKRSIEIRSLGTFFVKEIGEKNKLEIQKLPRLYMFLKKIRLDLGLVKDSKK